MLSEHHKSQIIFAVLGCAGIFVATVSSNWDKWFPRSALIPPATTTPEVTTTAQDTTTPSDTFTPSATLTPRVTPIPRVTVIPPSSITSRVTVIPLDTPTPPAASTPSATLTPRATPTPSDATIGTALKSCDELKAEIQAKLDAKRLTGYALTIMASGDLQGQNVVGSCEGNTKKIALNRSPSSQ